MAGLCQHTHTYENLRRDGAFCVNFLSKRYYDALIRTVEHNGPAEDEFAVGGFIEETARTVAVPRIAERFLTLECKCERIEDLSGEGLTAMVIGRVATWRWPRIMRKASRIKNIRGTVFSISFTRLRI